MMKLLNIEWLKLKRYPTFWIISGFFLVLLFFWNYEAMKGNIMIGGKKNNGISIINSDYSFPQAWSNLGYWGSIFILFISILVIILTTNEYGYRTNRQHVIDGLKRMQFYHAKVLLVFVLTIVTTLYVLLLGALLGPGSLKGFFNEFYLVGYFFLLVLDYLGFALFLAIWIKRSGLAVGIFLAYAMIIETMIKGLTIAYADKPYGNLLPLQASDELLPFPWPKMIQSMMHAAPAFSTTTYVCVATGWCLVYYFAGRAILQRSDW